MNKKMKHLAAIESIDQLDANKWSLVATQERLNLLYKIRKNLAKYIDELAYCDSNMKNSRLGEDLYSHSFSKSATVFPFATAVSACIDLYKSLIKGKTLQPISIKKVKDDLHDVHVFPKNIKDKIIYFGRKDYIRVKGNSQRIDPLNKSPEIIAILGAGNYSSSLEIIKAIFLENAAVIHKPHPINHETDKVWIKVLEPLIEIGALSFCEPNDGQALTQDKRLSKIYFTGGAKTAEAIMDSTNTPLISECGGNNPCIIVPGDRLWTKKEIKHQAIQIVTIAKLNGGAICGRPQTIITSKNWSQREEFLNAIRDAIKNDTPATGTYYPNSDQVKEDFHKNYPNAEIIKPENGSYKSSDFMLITNVNENDFCITKEAFCQIMDEISLDTAATAEEFLPKAVDFCNTKLHGTLTSCILIDETTKKANREILEKAITNMKYGSVTVNIMSVLTFFNPYLTWGGNEDKNKIVSGHGNFGNLLNYENVEKSIIYDKFISPGHLLNTNKTSMDKLYRCMANYSINPNWSNLFKMLATTVIGKLKKKDF
ncbi:aldehyde dehydrogenase family protein [Pseudofrancisella aestuarii]|uniref:Aldehyde dehydrogenase family protein n=1 Tax=Pseudofrancisella aestuarii TaxID=2670347 RepID=A0ABV9TCU4_9GAMM|nr:aldehyde dehydrogenase family protein [Pseudofrancisella aestuarii]